MILPHTYESLEAYKQRIFWANCAYNYADEDRFTDRMLQENYNNGILYIENKTFPKDGIVEFFLDYRKDELKGVAKIGDDFFKKLSSAFKGGIMLDKLLWRKKKTNIALFSAVKLATMLGAITHQSRGKSEQDYVQIASKEYEKYSGSHLATEQEVSFVNGRMSKSFKKFTEQTGKYPLLRYCTRLDNRVRPAHADLEGIIKPVEDEFWDKYTPPLGYNCRCWLRQTKEGIITSKKDTKYAIDLQEYTERKAVRNKYMDFKDNPFKTNFVFKEKGAGKHPYFEVANPDLVKGLLQEMFNIE